MVGLKTFLSEMPVLSVQFMVKRNQNSLTTEAFQEVKATSNTQP